MKDYVSEFLSWIAEDEQIALDNAGELVIQIDEAIRALGYQREAIESLKAHFGIKLHPEQAEMVWSKVRPDERVGLIKMRILWLLEEDYKTITPQMVLERLETDYIDLGVTHPTSVIGTVLARMDMFRRVREGEFEYVGGDGPLDKAYILR